MDSGKRVGMFFPKPSVTIVQGLSMPVQRDLVLFLALIRGRYSMASGKSVGMVVAEMHSAIVKGFYVPLQLIFVFPLALEIGGDAVEHGPQLAARFGADVSRHFAEFSELFSNFLKYALIVTG